VEDQAAALEQPSRTTPAKAKPARSLKTASMTDFLWRLAAAGGAGEAARRAAAEQCNSSAAAAAAKEEAQSELSRKVNMLWNILNVSLILLNRVRSHSS
jgi:hypothetical protein